EMDNTIMKVYLLHPLLPNAHTSFTVGFKTYWDNGSQRRRFKEFAAWSFKHYDGVHWYPRLCVYDRKFGWDTQQHLDKEFYGDFGTYEVSLSFPNNYVVEATGTLQNTNEVLPDTLRKKLDISNFARKPWNSEPSIVIPKIKGERKIWKYYAENIHDFAFTADPTYRIGESQWNGIKIIAMCEEPHCAGWQTVTLFGAAVVKTYSEDFGMYGWPKLVICDARDGMEYNMLNLDGGYEPTNYSLIAHEAGHEWFYGMVGNNETYRAALDEGFTQFIDSWCLEKLLRTGKLPQDYMKKGYYSHFKDSVEVKDGEVYQGYMNDAVKNADESINQSSDAFNGALGHGGGYRHVYFKTATMLWNLQYVLGDSLFNAAMKHYFNQWKFCHPYFEDFRNSMIQFTHVDLNWFFDEWMETTKNIDYKICGVKKVRGTKDKYEISFKRKGRMQMPIDFSVETKDGKTENYTIPNTWFAKSGGVTVLPKWYGWDKLEPTYTATVTSASKIKNITIDPTHRLADIYMPNNSWKCSTKWKFDSQISNPLDWKHYVVKWRPDVWYNAVDGIKPGLHFEGDYMKWRHVFDLNVWWNSKLLQQKTFNYGLSETQLKKVFPLSFTFDYKDNIRAFPKYFNWNLSARLLDGLLKEKLGLEILAGTKDVFNVYFQSLYRKQLQTPSLIYSDGFDKLSDPYLLFTDEWSLGKWNNTFNLDWKHNFNYIGGNSVLKMNLRATALWSATNYSWLNAELINHNKFWKFDIDTRVFAQYATGTIAEESKLWLSGNNPEGMMDDKFTRSVGYFPAEWTQFGSSINHFQDGGGLNLRGYAGYLAPEINKDGEIYVTYKGNSGAALNVEIKFNRIWNFQPSLTKNSFKLTPYFFGDAGMIAVLNANDKQQLAPMRTDAGLGCLFTIKRFFKLEEIKPFTVRADFPLFLS
ncbi:MAG: M1 family aminopeptidase, partial [Bacteroidota bacterium]